LRVGAVVGGPLGIGGGRGGGLFKNEFIRTTVFHQGLFRTIADVEFATAGWVDWYNQRRLHSSLDYLTPVEYEAAHDAALTQEPQPV
jgi:putative transposase